MLNTVLAVSPTPECLCLAARLRPQWQRFRVSGGKLVAELLAGLLAGLEAGAAPPRLIVMVADVQDPAAVRRLLQRFTQAGGQVIWLARESAAGVIKACTGVEKVKLVTAPSLTEACEAIFPARVVELDPTAPAVAAYLQYKINISFMRLMDEAPLREAVEVLARWRTGAFDLKRLAPQDAESVRHFQETDYPYFEGHSDPVVALKRRLLVLGPTPMSVLITGETGTGKEAVAFYLHEFSPRRAGPFVSINCAGLDEHTLRSELFGHRKGAFTGAISDRKGLVERASGGTLFFDELADMPLSVQADLLRFLQTRRFRPLGADDEKVADVRLVAAAQPSIYEKIAEGAFRADLYYRVAEVELRTPRLADLPEDIGRIVTNIVYRSRRQLDNEERIKATLEYFSQGAATLKACAWPGNVRELARYVRRRLFAEDDVLAEIAARKPLQLQAGGKYPIFKPVHSPEDIERLDEVVRKYVGHVYAQRGELTQQKVASLLGITPNTLKKYLD